MRDLSRSASILLLLFTALGCGLTSRVEPTILVAGDGATQRSSFDDWLKLHPLLPTQTIRSDVVAQTTASSVHIVQISDREQPHIHATHDLTVTLLRGEGVIFLNGAPAQMAEGDAVVIPRGVPHFFVNLGSGPGVAFVTFAPPFDGTDQVPVHR